MRKFILGLDEGTTNLKSALFDVEKKTIVDIEKRSFARFYPNPAWVEQDAEDTFNKMLASAKAVLRRNSVKKEELLAVAITNQRETVVAWDRETGKPIYNAIVWQCRRTSNMINNLSQETRQKIKELTGLIANPYFSASKMKWILENVKEARKLAKQNRLCFGTIDSFLAFRLTGNHVTDTTNASRTMLMNIHTLQWDDELLKIFKIPKDSLPKILPCDADFGKAKALLGANLRGMIGDQQSSMLGQGAIEKRDTKITYGTGGFILTNIGADSQKLTPNLITTVAYTLNGKTDYAVEGSIYSACSALNFLQDNLGLYKDVKETSKLASKLKDNDNVYFIPAFTGLGAPYWKDDARGLIVGLNFNTKKEHIIRAVLESMAYNTKDIIEELKKCGQNPRFFSVDGGGSQNPFLLQFLSDMLGHEVVKSSQSDSTVLGAIYVALISLELIDKKDIKEFSQSNNIYQPKMSEAERKKLYHGWQKAIKKI